MAHRKEEAANRVEAEMVASRVEEPAGYSWMDTEPPVRVQPFPVQLVFKTPPTTAESEPAGEGLTSCRVPERVLNTPLFPTTVPSKLLVMRITQSLRGFIMDEGRTVHR
jgi:hypothetical protein